MLAVSAPLVRGLSVVAIGAAIVLSHLSFATAKTKREQVAAQVGAESKADVSSTGSIGERRNLSDNCYWEFVPDVSATGTFTVRRVQECD
jgi:hypothetical protein